MHGPLWKEAGGLGPTHILPYRRRDEWDRTMAERYARNIGGGMIGRGGRRIPA